MNVPEKKRERGDSNKQAEEGVEGDWKDMRMAF